MQLTLITAAKLYLTVIGAGLLAYLLSRPGEVLVHIDLVPTLRLVYRCLPVSERTDNTPKLYQKETWSFCESFEPVLRASVRERRVCDYKFL